MPLTPGTGLGSYDIAEIIGVGGMGEVYRATDTRLKREVAIKVLPASFVDDAGRLARFQREAEVLAALNHPNIGQIYGIERTGGSSALVLELVEGPTLAERIARGPIPVDEALRIASQIAEALEAAHAKGIVHRDLKPANVKLREDGVVKVLDFGIAKAVEPAAADYTGPTPATPAPAMTEAGAVLGTLGYMAPEQARGRPIDKRTDIFAFGALFYEMLTGQPPFFGEDATEVIAAVLKSDPDWDALPELPPLVVAFVKQCLKKDPADRIHDIADVRLALTGRYELSVPAEAKGRGPRAWLLRVAGVAALTVAAAAAGWLAGPASAPAPSTGVETYATGPPVAAPLIVGGDRIVAASADGKRLAYLSDGSVWLQTLGRQDATPVARGRQPFFSADGEWVAFVSDAPALTKASIYDRVPVEIASLADEGRFLGGTWHGDTIVFATQNGVYRISATAEAEEPVLLLPTPADRSYAWPQFLPSGESVLLTVLSGDTIENASIVVVDLESARSTDALVRGAVGARYVPRSAGSGGYLVYATDRQGRLAMREFDPGTREVAAVPTDIPGVAVQVAGTYLAAAFDVSGTGALLYIGPRPAPQNRLVWIDPGGVEEAVDAALPGAAGYPRISPDGKRVAFDIGVGTTGRRIWTMDLGRGIPTRLSDSGDNRRLYEDFQALWSRDGARVYFASLRTGDFQIWSHAADGSGSDARLNDNPDVIVPLAWTPDDRLVVMRGPYTQADIGLLDPADPARVEWLIESPFSEITPSISPDGRWMAYASNEIGGRYEIFVQSFPSGGVRERISRNGAAYPAWGLDGELYYIGFDASGNAAMMAATLSTSNGLEVVAERVLFRKPVLAAYTQGGGLRPYDVSPIDGRILMPLAVSAQFDPLIGRMTIWQMRDWIEAP